MSSWWDDPGTDWSTDRPGRVGDILARAYDRPEAVRPFAAAIGADWALAPGPAAPVGDVWRWVLGVAARSGRVLDLMADVLGDPSASQFHAPLRRHLGDAQLKVYALLALRHGLPTLADGLADFEALVRAAPADTADEPVGTLQAITSPPAGFDDAAAFVQMLTDATRRIAMIEVGGQPAGTGLLIGPDLLLTAAHVLHPECWPPPGPPAVTARFDFVPTPGRSMGETGVRVAVIEFICGSLPTPDEVAGGPALETPPDRLDFALLRLERAVPAPNLPVGSAPPRGFYPMDRNTYAFDTAQLLLVVQHPLGGFQQVSYIKRPPTRNDNGTRIRYHGNTMRGSSGSPVLDTRGRLVAIHHYSASGTNQGVPISEIAGMVHAGPFAHLLRPGAASTNPAPAVAAPVPAVRVCIPDPVDADELIGRPFVNRERLRDNIRRMTALAGERTLTITGARRSGVTLSHRLMTHVASQSRQWDALRETVPGGIQVVRVDLRDYTTVEVADRWRMVADEIITGLGLRQPAVSIAQEARHVGMVKQWIAAALRSSDQQWWIFLDSVDDVAAARQGGVGELLKAILDLAEDIQVPLRVVLAGQQASLMSASLNAPARIDEAAGISRADAGRWLQRRVTQEGRTADEVLLDEELRTLFPPDEPDPPAERVALQLPASLLRLLNGGE